MKMKYINELTRDEYKWLVKFLETHPHYHYGDITYSDVFYDKKVWDEYVAWREKMKLKQRKKQLKSELE